MSTERNTEPKLVSTAGPKDCVGLYINRYPPIEKILFDPMKITTSQDPGISDLWAKIRKPVLEGECQGKVEKRFLPIDVSNFNDLGYTRVEGALKVEKHRHPGTMFTFLTAGELRINGTKLERGDWYIVPPGNEYEIESVLGYDSVFAYSTSC